jgi:hypothetical protein
MRVVLGTATLEELKSEYPRSVITFVKILRFLGVSLLQTTQKGEFGICMYDVDIVNGVYSVCQALTKSRS